MADDVLEDASTSVAAVLADDSGAMLVDVVTTDYESFYSALTPVTDVVQTVENEATDELYGGNFWILDLDRRDQDGAIFACDDDGCVHTNASGDWAIEKVSQQGLRSIRCLPDGSVFTLGTDGIVYRRDDEQWVKASESFGVWLTGIDGPSKDSFTICGDTGLLAQFKDGVWNTVEVATDATLNAVLWNGENYLIGGARGLLYRGDGLEWEDLSTIAATIHELTLHKGQIWAALGTDGVGQLIGNGLEVVRDTFAAYVLHAAGDYIVFGGNDIAMRFDGTNYLGRRYGG